jgi:hypothetical protein
VARDPQMSAKAQQQLGLPEGFKTWSPFPFGGMNAQASPIAIPDNEFTYVENYVRLGDGNLRTLWDAGSAIYTALPGVTIVWYTFYTIALVDYCAIFLSDGTGLQLNMDTFAQTQMNTALSFYDASTGYLPYAKQWGSIYLLICNRNTPNDYWVWDGDILYGAGTVAPNGVNILSVGNLYNTNPSYQVYGGSGSGVVLQTIVLAGSIVAIDILNPGSGYAPGDVVQIKFNGGGSDTSAELAAVLYATSVESVIVIIGGTGYTSAPTVTISGGGGSGATATAVVANGTVTQINMVGLGSGYTDRPTVSISGGGGSGATAYADLIATGVSHVTVVDGGTGFFGVPLLSFQGGGGAGATGTAVMAGPAPTSIASVTVGSAGQGYTSAPAVVVEGGQNESAYATINLMPYGVSGSAMETYLSRVWILNPATAPNQTIPPGNQWSASAPGSVTDFATSDGAVESSNTDAFLQKTYVNVRQSSGYLYFYGDGSVSSVSNVNTSGSPPSTTFNYLNIDPQAGLLWRDSIADFGKSTIIANETGIWGLFGGSLRKISEKLDQFLNALGSGGKAVYPSNGGITPSAAVATIYNVKHYLNLMTIQDPDTGLTRNVMAMWNEKDWTIASQSVALTFIATQKIASKYYAYGTDANSIYPLFDTPSSTLAKRSTRNSMAPTAVHSETGLGGLFTSRRQFAEPVRHRRCADDLCFGYSDASRGRGHGAHQRCDSTVRRSAELLIAGAGVWAVGHVNERAWLHHR